MTTLADIAAHRPDAERNLDEATAALRAFAQRTPEAALLVSRYFAAVREINILDKLAAELVANGKTTTNENPI